MEELLNQIRNFVNERDWIQFHSTRTLSTSIAIEAAELLEITQWVRDEDLDSVVDEKRNRVGEEIADVLIYALLLADHLDFDPSELIVSKLKINMERYPIGKARGNSTKHTDL